eukprot:m.173067 g.173067  ORF g.173067 m.173067 type:complete len:74 (+) comp16727_c0_seq10:3659-3880(+)
MYTCLAHLTEPTRLECERYEISGCEASHAACRAHPTHMLSRRFDHGGGASFKPDKESVLGLQAIPRSTVGLHR